MQQRGCCFHVAFLLFVGYEDAQVSEPSANRPAPRLGYLSFIGKGRVRRICEVPFEIVHEDCVLRG